MRQLFNEDGTYTNEAFSINEEFAAIAERFLNRYKDVYSHRELTHLLQLAVFEAELLVSLERKEQ